MTSSHRVQVSTVAMMTMLIKQLVSVGSQGATPDEDGTNFLLSVVKGIEPRDQIETMLAAQMAAVHTASMTMARRLATVENIEQQDCAERAFNKLTRTFAVQVEALKNYRSKGEQKMTVQHVQNRPMRNGSRSLSKFASPVVSYRLRALRTHTGSYRRDGLVSRFGPDAAPPDVLMALASCQQRADFSRPCGARLDAYRRMLTSTSMRRRITSLQLSLGSRMAMRRSTTDV
jgi:hypothetical protein